jgi:hypothetical protein
VTPASRPSRTPRRIGSAILSIGLLAVAALVAALSAGAFEGAGAGATEAAVRVDLVGTRSGTTFADAGHTAFDPAGVGTDGGLSPAARRCHPVARPAHYVNPLANAKVTPERIDQGVDYAGSGTLGALGSARVTHVELSGTGWPGAFIAYRLLAGADAGCYVFYAEGVRPVRGLHAGQIVAAGQPIATIIPGYSTGIELGWGAGDGTRTYAAATTGWTSRDDAGNRATRAGKSFSALIAALGGKAGVQEG